MFTCIQPRPAYPAHLPVVLLRELQKFLSVQGFVVHHNSKARNFCSGKVTVAHHLRGALEAVAHNSGGVDWDLAKLAVVALDVDINAPMRGRHQLPVGPEAGPAAAQVPRPLANCAVPCLNNLHAQTMYGLPTVFDPPAPWLTARPLGTAGVATLALSSLGSINARALVHSEANGSHAACARLASTANSDTTAARCARSRPPSALLPRILK